MNFAQSKIFIQTLKLKTFNKIFKKYFNQKNINAGLSIIKLPFIWRIIYVKIDQQIMKKLLLFSVITFFYSYGLTTLREKKDHIRDIAFQLNYQIFYLLPILFTWNFKCESPFSLTLYNLNGWTRIVRTYSMDNKFHRAARKILQ